MVSLIAVLIVVTSLALILTERLDHTIGAMVGSVRLPSRNALSCTARYSGF